MLNDYLKADKVLSKRKTTRWLPLLSADMVLNGLLEDRSARTVSGSITILIVFG